jgi:uncharacterized membrane protein
MSAPAEVMVAVFDNRASAEAVVDTLKQMNKSGAIKLIDAAIITQEESGKPKINEIRDVTTVKGGERGAIVGGVLGLIFPPSILGTAALGAVAGGLWGRLRDTGIKTDELKQVAAELKPGEVAVVAVAEDKWVEQLTTALSGYDRLMQHALDAKAAAVLMADPATGDVYAAGFDTTDAGGDAGATGGTAATSSSPTAPAATGSAAAGSTTTEAAPTTPASTPAAPSQPETPGSASSGSAS